MKLSVIVPSYNEEGNVLAFYDTFTQVFKDFKGNYEIIYVNDGSKDKTLDNLKEIIVSAKNVKVVNFSRNFGKEAAMYAGLNEATGEYTAIIDADLQQRPEILLKMIKMLDENEEYDSVCAYQAKRKEGKFLVFLKKCFYGLINKVSDVRFVEGASDFRVFRKVVREAMLSLEETTRFTKGIFSYVGFNTHYIPYCAEDRNSGSSKWSLKSLFKYAISGILSFSTLPLRIALPLGGVTLIGSFIYLIVSLILKVELTTMMIFFFLSFFSGVQLVTIGFLSRYMQLMYSEIKKRPVYIVKEVLTSKHYKK